MPRGEEEVVASGDSEDILWGDDIGILGEEGNFMVWGLCVGSLRSVLGLAGGKPGGER